MTTVFIRHKMKDFTTWKKVYDAYDKKSEGCSRATIHRDSADPKTLIVTETFPDVASAQAHITSDKLKNAMNQAGVEGIPQIWMTEDIEDVRF